MAEVLPVKYIKFNTKRCFGIELEVNKSRDLDELVRIVRSYDMKRQCKGSNNYQQDVGNDYWHVKFDRSCGTKANEGGWEISSYKASGANDLMILSQMGEVLKNNGIQINDKCGYHIHVEIADFSNSQAATLMAYWMKLEKMILEIVPKNRRANEYCWMLNDVKPVTALQAKNIETFWARVRPQSMENPERRVALNMCNFVHNSHNKKTSELRLPEGTLESKDIKNWARMFIHFVNACRTSPYPGNIVPYPDLKSAMVGLGLHNEQPFYILSKGLYETKTWFLERALKYGVTKSVRSEAEELLSMLIPPSPEDKIESDVKSEKKIKPVKKTVEEIKKKKLRTSVPRFGDYGGWSSYNVD